MVAPEVGAAAAAEAARQVVETVRVVEAEHLPAVEAARGAVVEHRPMVQAPQTVAAGHQATVEHRATAEQQRATAAA
jgi:hypothetical protein